MLRDLIALVSFEQITRPLAPKTSCEDRQLMFGKRGDRLEGSDVRLLFFIEGGGNVGQEDVMNGSVGYIEWSVDNWAKGF